MSHFLNRALVASSFAVALSSSLVLGTGCATDAYCFDDCENQSGVGTGGRAGSSTGQGGGISLKGGTGGTGGSGGGGIVLGGSGGGGGACIASTELCDGKDNDCDGKIDNVDFTKPANCGNCETNCFVGKDALQGTTTPVCVPPVVAGTPGTCSYEKCAEEYFDLDGKKSNGCEFRCTTKTADDDKICNNRDDNCNNQVDEDVDFCLPASCGACSPCTTLNADTKCVKADATKGTCKSNATCQIAKCKPGFVDANNSYADGCELPCTPSNGGKEICDGFDNDCNGSIDDLGKDDPKSGKECFGDGVTVVVGECGAGTHAGVYACKAGKYTCAGPNVLLPNTATEICDGKDNDCDGNVDESFPNGGSACGGVANGQSLGLCKAGSLVCADGKESCSGSIPPQEETCDGEDDDCDDVIDGTVVGAPVDCSANAALCKAGETCQALSSTPSKRVCAKGATGVGAGCNDTFKAPPSGLVSACKAGVLACQGGVPVCVGFIEAPPAGVDACGIDVNCDGVATPGSQPDLQTDEANCGECGKRCGFVNNVGQICVSGKCENDPNPANCGPGIISCNAGSCNTACVKQSDQEICNNIDDDCDCRIDELAADTGDAKDIALPNAAATCSSALGLEPECKSGDASNPLGVVVKCTAGKLVCEFKNGFCASGDCAATGDDCDGKDNNCNGVADESFRNLGSQSLDTKCFSDDGKPFPGDGACRREGKFVCDTAKATKCSVKNLPSKCGTGPDGNGKDCDELCDGVDNDCDGVIDEPKSAAGNNPTYYVKPAVVSLAGGKLIQAYEASRPEATDKSADSGNGYFTSAPPGETLDRTYACSEKGVVPWFLVTPREVEQSCAAIGGHICSTKEWQVACKSSTGACKWGYDSACSTSAPSKCNLDVAGDGDKSVATTGKDPTTCFADHGGGGAVFDVTGNLREITRCQKDGTPCGTAAQCAAGCCATTTSDAGGIAVCGTGGKRIVGSACSDDLQCVDQPNTTDECRNSSAGGSYCGGKRGRGVDCTKNGECLQNDCIDSVCGGAGALPGATYPVMGGAFSSGDENGAACDFTFYQVGEAFKLYDTGFRCCFDADPR